MNEYIDANRKNWNDRVAGHVAPDGYDPDRFVRDPKLLSQTIKIDRETLGDIRGKRVLHLQCHIGTDSISLARLGAQVTGLDFSAPALEAAQSLAAATGDTLRTVESNVLDAVQALDGERFELVYASVGVLGWIPDLTRWMQTAADCLELGGRLVVRDVHPALLALDDERKDDLLLCRYPCFGGERLQWDNETSYSGSAVLKETRQYEWAHGLGDILTALLASGLRLELFEELDSTTWQALPVLEQGEDGLYRFPEKLRKVCPLCFRLGAVKSEN